MTIRGSVDVVTETEVRGWAFAPGRGEPVLVQAMLNFEIVGEATADIYRPDLAAAGLGDGNSGYTINLYRPIDALYLPFLVVKVDSGDAELPRAPRLGFAEFFHSLYIANPGAGRSRSVFGGLWIDRIDASALLRGKMATGQITPRTGASIAQIVKSGFVAFELLTPLSLDAWEIRLANQVGDLLEDPTLLAFLRAVLEDNPLVVRIDWLREAEGTLIQPSVSNAAPSPPECVSVVVGFGRGVYLDIVRESHGLPEFTPQGRSRWADGEAGDGIAIAGASGFLDRHVLEVGTAVVIGAGTINRVYLEEGAVAVRILCLPERGMPMTLAMNGTRKSTARASGVRIVIE